MTTKKAVIAAAGLGTRLLTATKELPKEMLSIYSSGADGSVTLKPVVQLIFEQLYRTGTREFCFVVGRGKRAIEDHFTPDTHFVEWLERKGKRIQARTLRDFYSMVNDSSIYWINQPRPRGFGDAVLCAKSFVSGEPFLVHAGDNYVHSHDDSFLPRMFRVKEKTGAEAVLFLRKIPDPRLYGVAEVSRIGGELRVLRVVEKPKRPKSKLALLPVYLLEQSTLDLLAKTKPGIGGEVQLTDAIQGLIDEGMKVSAAELIPGECWHDVGTPETYWQALKMSHERCS